jgi:cytochrome c553
MLSMWLRACATGAAAIAFTVSAHAAVGGSDGRQLAASCSSCHGTPGANSAIPAIAGQDKALIVQAMLAFRDGTRQGPIMHIVASALSTDEIAALADYLSTQHDVVQQDNAEAAR